MKVLLTKNEVEIIRRALLQNYEILNNMVGISVKNKLSPSPIFKKLDEIEKLESKIKEME